MYFLDFVNHISLAEWEGRDQYCWHRASRPERASSQRVESGRYQQWPTASDGQSLPVAFTHCHNYFHFPYFSPFYFCFLSNLNIKKEVRGCLSVRKYVCKHFSQIPSLSLFLSFLLSLLAIATINFTFYTSILIIFSFGYLNIGRFGAVYL